MCEILPGTRTREGTSKEIDVEFLSFVEKGPERDWGRNVSFPKVSRFDPVSCPLRTSGTKTRPPPRSWDSTLVDQETCQGSPVKVSEVGGRWGSSTDLFRGPEGLRTEPVEGVDRHLPVLDRRPTRRSGPPVGDVRRTVGVAVRGCPEGEYPRYGEKGFGLVHSTVTTP